MYDSSFFSSPYFVPETHYILTKERHEYVIHLGSVMRSTRTVQLFSRLIIPSDPKKTKIQIYKYISYPEQLIVASFRIFKSSLPQSYFIPSTLPISLRFISSKRLGQAASIPPFYKFKTPGQLCECGPYQTLPVKWNSDESWSDRTVLLPAREMPYDSKIRPS